MAACHRDSGAHDGDLSTLVAGCQAMREAVRGAQAMACTDDVGLIYGSVSGAGKRTLAHAIHHASGRGDGPFVVFNPNAMTEHTLEQQMYGGAGTEGSLEQAAGGTLLIWYADWLPDRAREKLLEALQTRSYRHDTGARHAIQARVLLAFAQEGNFSALESSSLPRIVLPPFSERGSDKLALSEWLLRHHQRQHARPDAFFSEKTRQAILAYDWPGGAREMENSIIRALFIEPRDELIPEALGLERWVGH